MSRWVYQTMCERLRVFPLGSSHSIKRVSLCSLKICLFRHNDVHSPTSLAYVTRLTSMIHKALSYYEVIFRYSYQALPQTTRRLNRAHNSPCPKQSAPKLASAL